LRLINPLPAKNDFTITQHKIQERKTIYYNSVTKYHKTLFFGFQLLHNNAF